MEQSRDSLAAKGPAARDDKENELEELQIQLLLEGIFCRYGYDFRDYAPASLRRRICKCIGEENLETVSAFQDRILRDAACMERLLLAISVDVTEMFRDPSFFLAFRQQAVPLLRDLPFLRFWHVGCATGEEVYSMAILLEEEGLYDRTRLYATDMNHVVLDKAKAGIFPLAHMQQYTENYRKAGGTRSFSEYYVANYGNVLFRRNLQRNVVWGQHNLVTDSSFNEFHVILCRNVLIYFNRALQGRVHRLLYESLAPSGILGLGSKESLQFTPYEDRYEELVGKEKLFRQVR